LTEVRVAAYDFSISLPWPGRVLERTVVVIGSEPLVTPLPDVADDVVETELVWRERVHGSSSVVPVLDCIVRGELALLDITSMVAVRREFVPPRESFPDKSAACSAFPLGLGREAFVGPVGVGDGIAPRNVDDRMGHSVRNARPGSIRTESICFLDTPHQDPALETSMTWSRCSGPTTSLKTNDQPYHSASVV